MFYYTEEGWKPYRHKISYKEPVTTYDNVTAPYESMEEYSVEDITLTEEQLKRLNTLRKVPSVGVEDVKNYVLDGVISDPSLVELQTEVTAEDTRQKLAELIRWDEISTEDMLALVSNFKEYEVGSYYVTDDIFNYENQLYKVIQTHTAQSEWVPGAEGTEALYLPIAPPATDDGTEIVPDWVQPTGAHDAYNTGDKVLFEGRVYESLIDGNSWSPTAYPQGWQLIL